MTETYSGADIGPGNGKEWLRKARKCFSTAERYNAQKTWSLMAEFILPSQNREWFGDVSKGIRRDRRVFDSTAVRANRDLASAMHATITNPTMKWCKLRFKGDNTHLNDNQEAAIWLDQATDAFHNALGDSNFDAQLSKSYLSICSLGTFILFMDEDFTFYSWHLAEVAFQENRYGMVDVVYRKFKLSAKQAYEQFGDAVGETVLKKLDTDPTFEFDFYHCVYPREEKQIKLNEIGLAGDPRERPFASLYIMEKGSKIVKEDGHYECPIFVSRWSNLPGEVYGFGPGNICIADIRTLNKMREEDLRAKAKAVNPPILATKQNIVSGDLTPGGITQVRDMQGFQELVTKANFPAIQADIQDLRKQIEACYYIDKLLLPPRTETGEMTAYEVQQRLAQMQTILGPVLSRLNSDFLNPLVLRCLKILIRRKKLAPIPQSIGQYLKTNKYGHAELEFEIMYVNAFARSQQMDELQNVNQWVQETAQLAQLDQSVLDNINKDAIVQYAAQVRAIPEHLVMSSAQIKQTRAQRQKMQQMQAMMQMGEQGSNITKNIGQAQQAMTANKDQNQGGGQQ